VHENINLPLEKLLTYGNHELESSRWGVNDRTRLDIGVGMTRERR